MARDLIPSDATIKAIRPGDKRQRLSDGDGLFLMLYVKGASHGWRFTYTFQSRRNMISLGTYPKTSLAQARRLANAARVLVAEGKDPSAERKAEKQQALKIRAEQKRQAAGLPPLGSFEAVAREWFDVRRSGWSRMHCETMMHRFEVDVFPGIGATPIAEVTGPMLLEVLRRIEARGAIETAHRALADCSQVFGYAIATDRIQQSPAAKLKLVLQQPESRNFPAITDPTRLSELLQACDRYRARPVVAAALRLAPMLLLRPGELRCAEWPEIDLDAAMWTVPAVRMKRLLREKMLGPPHLVPLPRQAVAILRELHAVTGHAKMVFRGERFHERPMSSPAILVALRTMGFSKEMTGHGFRATARTMLHERLGFSPDVIEAQLAHTVRDSLGRSYNRTQFTEQRREMLQAWADYLDELRAGHDIARAGASASGARSSATRDGVPSDVSTSPGTDDEALLTGREFSTIEAAKFLNVPHLVVAQEIDAGRLATHQVGADLRISVADLVTYALQTRVHA
jgi:integrase